MTTTTLVQPEWKKASGRNTICGILFISYRTGILRFVRVSEDGRIKLGMSARDTAYQVEVLGYGWIKSEATGKTKRFRSAVNAVKAAQALLVDA